MVSSLDDADKIQVYFNGFYFFFSQYGKTVKPETVLIQKIPKQYAATGLTASLAAAKDTLSSTTNAVMAGNMVLNIVLSASLQQLWSMINT